MTSKFNFKEEWYFLKQDIVSYTIATAVYIGLCLLREVSLQTFIYNLFNCLFFFMSFWYIRCRFDKTYHSDSWSHCKMWTRIMLVCGVFMLWLLPLEYSLFNSLFVATICCLVLYLVAVEVEEKKSLIPTHKDIYAMNETELYEHCRNCGLDDVECKIAYYVVIERLKGKELYEAIGYSEAQAKRKRKKILNMIK